VVAIVLSGALGVISSTQTWLMATLAGAAVHELAVSGAAAVPVLAPLSLAVLALGGALSIVGTILRHAFAVLTILIGGALSVLSAQIAFAQPVTAAASTVTSATGITGAEAVSDLVARITATPWPAVTLLTSLILLAAGVFTLVTARRWRGSGRRYETDAAAPAVATHQASSSRPPDAIDSWDDLSRGDDPTTAPR
jgi:hypothetical protein